MHPPFFKCCAELQLQGVLGFLDDPAVQPGGQSLTNEQLLRKKSAVDLQVVKVTPPSVLCKRLWDKNNYPEAEEIRAVAVAAFGIRDAGSVRAVQDWFAHRRLQQFAKAEEHLKRRCGMVTPRVKGEVERLLRLARCCLGLNGQCTVANHLEERLLDQAQARASYTPLFWGHSRSIPQGMILDVQPLVKSLFCPIRASPNGFFDFEASTP